MEGHKYSADVFLDIYLCVYVYVYSCPSISVDSAFVGSSNCGLKYLGEKAIKK